MTKIISDELHDSGKANDSIDGKVVVRDALPGRVPLVPWHRLGNWEALRSGNDSDFEWYPTQKQIPHGRGMAAVLHGDSMVAPAGPSFPPGTIIVIEDRRPKVGELVVATVAGAPTFKQLVEDAGVHYLAPLNKQYPIIQLLDDSHITGVLVEAVSRISL